MSASGEHGGVRVAVVDDYAGVAKNLADWSAVEARADVEVFREHLTPDAARSVLAGFDVICSMRERMAMPADLLEALPRLRLITITGGRNTTLDLEAATSRGILVCNTAGGSGGGSNATVELAWGLILSAMRNLPGEVAGMRRGGWQTRLGAAIGGRTLGLLGLGRLGSRMVPVARAFGMEVIAWSPNLTDAAARQAGATWVEHDELFSRSDILSIHLVLGERSRGAVGARELGLMKPDAWLVNTSRGPIVERQALLKVLTERRIGGAALDVFDAEPLPKDDPLRGLDNAILTPHLGYSVTETFADFYAVTADNVAAFLAGRPQNVVNPQVLGARRGP